MEKKLPYALKTLNISSILEMTDGASVMPKMLEIVSTVYEYPSVDESMFDKMRQLPGDPENFIRQLARFCGRNPELGTKYKRATMKILRAECRCLGDDEISNLVRKSNKLNTNILRDEKGKDELIDALCKEEEVLDLENAHLRPPGWWCGVIAR